MLVGQWDEHMGRNDSKFAAIEANHFVDGT